MEKINNILLFFKNILFDFDNDKIDYSSKKFDIADFAMILFFAQRFVTYMAVLVLGKIGPIFVMGSLGIVYFVSIVYKYKENKKSGFLIFFSILLLIMALSFLSILRTPDLKFWIFGSQMNLPTQLIDVRKNIFALLLMLLVKDFKKILRNLYFVSLINFFYLVYQATLFLVLGNWNSYYSLPPSKNLMYNMSYGYEMIFVCVVLLTMSLIKKSIKLLFLSSVALALSVFFGSRGSLLVFATYVLLILFLYAGDSYKLTRKTIKRKLKYFLNFVSVLLISIMIILLIPKINSFFNHTDENTTTEIVEVENRLTSRTMDSVLDGEFLATNGRLKIWQQSFNSFLESPIFGKGIYGDRLEIGKRWYWGYSHNIVLELMNHFGIIGLVFFCFLFYSVIKKIITSKEHAKRLLYIIVLSLCAKLLLSDSYLLNAYFWMLIGLLIVDSKFIKRLSNRKIKSASITILILSILSSLLFLLNDYRNQDFKTIKFSKPTAIISTTNTNIDTFSIYQTIQEFDYKAVYFISASTITNAEVGKLTIDEFIRMNDYNSTFEDGEFIYQNPYIRPEAIQVENRIKTEEFFLEHDLEKPIAYAPPFGAHNSTIEYRCMNDYSFIQVNKSETKPKPINNITYPGSLNIQARQLYWKNEAEKTDLIQYIKKAKNEGSLIILNINTKNYDSTQVIEILTLLKDNDFESITYKDLYGAAKLSSENISLKNYIENTYLYNYINKYLK